MLASYKKCPGVIVGFDGAHDLQSLALKEYEGTRTVKNEGENDEYLVDNVELEKVEFTFDHGKHNNETSFVDVPNQKLKKVLVKSPPACEIEIVSPNSFAAIRRRGHKIEAMAPIHADTKLHKPNVKIYDKDTNHFAAMLYHQKIINEKIRILQRSVPGGTEFCRDKAAMLEEVINYIKFLEDRVQLLEQGVEGVESRGSLAPTENGGYIDDEETQERMDMLWELMNEESKDGCEGKKSVKGSSSSSPPVRRWLLPCPRGRCPCH